MFVFAHFLIFEIIDIRQNTKTIEQQQQQQQQLNANFYQQQQRNKYI
jgi:hypothetical protein